MRTAGGLSTDGGASTVTLHDHAHRRWPGYPRVLWVRDVCRSYSTTVVHRCG